MTTRYRRSPITALEPSAREQIDREFAKLERAFGFEAQRALDEKASKEDLDLAGQTLENHVTNTANPHLTTHRALLGLNDNNAHPQSAITGLTATLAGQASTSHATTHATGGSDSVAPGDIGAEVAGAAATVQGNLNTHTGDSSIHWSIVGLPNIGAALTADDKFPVYDDSTGQQVRATLDRIAEFLLGSGIGLASQAEAEAGTETAGRIFSPLRVKQAIDALSPSGVTDHGALTGLNDDDHPQYHNNARGDARYDALGSASTVQGNLNTHTGNSSIHTPVPAKMPTAEAEAGTATTQRTIDAATLAAAIAELGSVVTGWTTYTPAWSSTETTQPAVGNGTLTGRWRRVGDMAEYEIYLLIGTTTTFGDGKWRFSVDTGNSHVVDTADLLRTTGSCVLGAAVLFDASTGQFLQAPVAQHSTSNLLVMIRGDTETGYDGFPNAQWGYDDTAGTGVPIATFSTSDFVQLRFSVPISGWSA